MVMPLTKRGITGEGMGEGNEGNFSFRHYEHEDPTENKIRNT